MPNAIFELDTLGLRCPEPVMLLRKKMRDLENGQCLRVIADDPSTQRDIPKFCQFMDHQLIEQKEENQRFIFLVQKGNT